MAAGNCHVATIVTLSAISDFSSYLRERLNLEAMIAASGILSRSSMKGSGAAAIDMGSECGGTRSCGDPPAF